MRNQKFIENYLYLLILKLFLKFILMPLHITSNKHNERCTHYQGALHCNILRVNKIGFIHILNGIYNFFFKMYYDSCGSLTYIITYKAAQKIQNTFPFFDENIMEGQF